LIRPITFHLQMVKSEDDAHIRNVLMSGESGTTKGCNITHTSDNITISNGYFCAFGRWVAIDGEENIGIDGISSGIRYCILVYTIDLSRINTEEGFSQGKFEIVKADNDYPALIKENLDDGGEVYQLEFARFIQTLTGITEFDITIENIVASMVTKNMIVNNTTTTTAGYALDALVGSQIWSRLHVIDEDIRVINMQPYFVMYKTLKAIQSNVFSTSNAFYISHARSIVLSAGFSTSASGVEIPPLTTLLDFSDNSLVIEDTPCDFYGRVDTQSQSSGWPHVETFQCPLFVKDNKLICRLRVKTFSTLTIDNRELVRRSVQ